jgi:hypothetical protein
MLAPLDGFSGFTMAHKVPRYLAEVMLPRKVQFRRFAQLHDRATAFVANMVKDTPFWKDWPLPEPKALECLTPPIENGDETLRATLAALPLGARAHAMDASVVAVRLGSNQAGSVAIALEQGTTYVTRQHGCDPDESAVALLDGGLFLRPEDPASYLRGLTQRELVELGTLHATPIKKSWAKAKLAVTIAAIAPDSAREAMSGHQVGIVAPRFVDAVIRALTWLEATTPAWSLVASFAIPPEQPP